MFNLILLAFCCFNFVHSYYVQPEAPWNLARLSTTNWSAPEEGQTVEYRYPSNIVNMIQVYILNGRINEEAADFGERVRNGPDLSDGGNSQFDGTGLASLVNGQTYGVAKNATVIGVTVVDNDGSVKPR